jgi:inhibitor of KinA sporulation pathway (predicted exonuclease)
MAVEYGLRSGEGMDRALERFKIKPEGVHHRGKDDAHNIARIFAEHLKRVRNK